MSGSTTAQPLEYEQISYNSPDGAQFGKASTELISFLGATPSSASTIVSTFAITTASVSTAGIFGFVTSTQANAISAAVSELKRKGLIA